MTYAALSRRAGTRRDQARPRWRRRGVAGAFALLLAASLAVAGCGASGGGSASSDKAAAPAPAQQRGDGPATAPTGGAAAGGSGGDSQKPSPVTYLVRTANLTVRTPHVEEQLDRARELAAQAGGYAGDENTEVDARGHAESTVQLRVPAAGYDRLLTDLAGLGTLLERKVNVEDVTGQVVDVQSRIKSQQASVARVRALMDRATSLTEVVSLESELSTREADLEALEAQQASLRSRTDLATVTLRLTEPPAKPVPPKPVKPEKHDGFWTTIGHALGDGWHAFCMTVRVVLVVLSVTLPFLVVVLLGWALYRLVRKRLPAGPRRLLSGPEAPWLRHPAPAPPTRAPVPAPAPAGTPGNGPGAAPGTESGAGFVARALRPEPPDDADDA